MNILAFDTSSQACSIAISTAETIHLHHQIVPRQQAQLLLPAIHALLHTSSLTLNDLDLIIYGRGPGSFTGNRIAACTAQGLGYALQKPILPISSLAGLAQAMFLTHQCKQLLIAIDAHHEGKIYWAYYQADHQGYASLVGEEQTCLPDFIKVNQALTQHNDCYVTGDAWIKYKEILIERLGFGPIFIEAESLPLAKGILILGKQR